MEWSNFSPRFSFLFTSPGSLYLISHTLWCLSLSSLREEMILRICAREKAERKICMMSSNSSGLTKWLLLQPYCCSNRLTVDKSPAIKWKLFSYCQTSLSAIHPTLLPSSSVRPYYVMERRHLHEDTTDRVRL
jgi:hypothetical protein